MRLLTICILSLLAGALAAQSTDQDAAASGETADTPVICEPDPSAASDDGSGGEEPAPQDCIDPGPGEGFENEDFARAASVDEEFTPEDEISEDYPVPLPADI